ncbi:MAG: hypothetical protein VZQ47_02145 [Treponema sp.]|nr:hypothetical protein [Treponema sp.]MEE3434342.1 hypothetical protein [Treponema sp.]
MPIVIKPLLPEQGEEALLFLQPYESECVNLASELLRGGTDCWALYYAEPSQASGSVASQTETRANSGSDLQGQKLAGLFALRKKRSLFFCLPFAKYKSAFDKKVCSEAQRPLMEFFESREPFCVNGEAAGAIFLRNILKNKKSPMRPSVTNKYFLMVSDAENQEASQNKKAVHAQDAGGGLRVVQATAADYERLLPLELGYQREEVVPKSFDISDAALAAAFKHELGQGLTFALYDGGRPIAKARVSACGLRHCMLGGVYTIPSERKKGRASFLVRQIMSLFESGLEGQRQTAGGQNCSQGLDVGGGSIDSGKPCSFGIASDSCAFGDSRPSLAFDSFCLYAKQENAAALALYKSLGFTSRGEYLLVYY